MSDLKLQVSAAQSAYYALPGLLAGVRALSQWQRFCAPRCRASEHRRIRSGATSTRSVAVVSG